MKSIDVAAHVLGIPPLNRAQIKHHKVKSQAA